MRHNPTYSDPTPGQGGDPNLERMHQLRSGGYLNEQSLLRALNMQRMLSGKDAARSLDEAIGGGVRPVNQTEVPPLQINPALLSGTRPGGGTQQGSGGESSLASVGNAIAAAFGQLGKQRPQQQRGVPLPPDRPAAAGPSRQYQGPPGAPVPAGQGGVPTFAGGKDFSGVDKRFLEAATQYSELYSDATGNKVNFTSGKRLQSRSSGSEHIHGHALDMQITRPGETAPLENYKTRNPETFKTYQDYSQGFKQFLDKHYPDLGQQYRWGGYFSGDQSVYGGNDVMHHDLGGAHGRGMLGGDFQKGLYPQQAKLYGLEPGGGLATTQPRTNIAQPRAPGAQPAQQPAAPAGASQPSAGRLPTEAELSNKNIPVGERFNNPFNMWHDKYAAIHGGADPAKMVTPQDRPASFPSKVDGAAAAIRKMAESPLYTGKTMSDLIGTWVNHGVSYAPIIEKATGISRNTRITPEFLKSEQGLNFLKTMARYETKWEQPYPLSDAEWRTARDKAFGSPQAARAQPAQPPASQPASQPAAAQPPGPMPPQAAVPYSNSPQMPRVGVQQTPQTPQPPRPAQAPVAPPAAAAPATPPSAAVPPPAARAPAPVVTPPPNRTGTMSVPGYGTAEHYGGDIAKANAFINKNSPMPALTPNFKPAPGGPRPAGAYIELPAEAGGGHLFVPGATKEQLLKMHTEGSKVMPGLKLKEFDTAPSAGQPGRRGEAPVDPQGARLQQLAQSPAAQSYAAEPAALTVDEVAARGRGGRQGVPLPPERPRRGGGDQPVTPAPTPKTEQQLLEEGRSPAQQAQPLTDELHQREMYGDPYYRPGGQYRELPEAPGYKQFGDEWGGDAKPYSPERPPLDDGSSIPSRPAFQDQRYGGGRHQLFGAEREPPLAETPRRPWDAPPIQEEIAYRGPPQPPPEGFASVRTNNPGAQAYSPLAARQFGATSDKTGAGFSIAQFPSATHGAASNIDLYTRNYTGKPVGQAVGEWSSGGRHAVPGYDPKMIVTKEMMADPNFAVPYMKSLISGEAPGKYPLTDEQWQQAYQWSRQGYAPDAPAARTQGGGVPLPPERPRTLNMERAQTDMKLTPQERALYERHLENLYGPGGFDQPNGARSSLLRMSVEGDGRTYSVPSVYEGKQVSGPEAIRRAREQGWDKFPSYPTRGEADRRYNQMHEYMDRDTGEYRARNPAQPQQPEQPGPGRPQLPEQTGAQLPEGFAKQLLAATQQPAPAGGAIESGPKLTPSALPTGGPTTSQPPQPQLPIQQAGTPADTGPRLAPTSMTPQQPGAAPGAAPGGGPQLPGQALPIGGQLPSEVPTSLSSVPYMAPPAQGVQPIGAGNLSPIPWQQMQQWGWGQPGGWAPWSMPDWDMGGGSFGTDFGGFGGFGGFAGGE